MAKLTSKQRNRLSSKSFAEPGKRAYPINDKSHARNALARVSQFGSPREKATVRAAVHAKYPAMGQAVRCRIPGCGKSHPDAQHHGE